MTKLTNKTPLTFSGLFLLVIVCLTVAVCNKKADFTTAEQTIETLLAQEEEATFTGHTYVKLSENNEVLIMQYKNDPATIETIFVLALEQKNKMTIQAGDLGLSTAHYYKDKRAVVLHAADNTLHFIGLNEAASDTKLDRIKASTTLAGSLQTTVKGFGLSMIKGKWDANTLLNENKKYIFNLIALANKEKVLTPAQRAAVTADEGISCTSGGPGSVSCSSGTSGVGCSVTCSSGYYACCSSSTNNCFCAPSKAQPQWAQCGGIGWTGPTACAVPYECEKVNDYFFQCQ